MKFCVTFKTPDAITDAIKHEVHNSLVEKSEISKLNFMTDMYAVASKFVQYGESITIEFDTTANTATVVPRTKKT